jgi:heme-degrading monooxygenase HmoA
MAIVSITRLRVRHWWFLPQFFVYALRSARQAAAADGNLAVTLLRDRNNTFWTGTSWSDEAAIKTFMHAAPHGPAMRRLLEWCDEASLVRWTQDSHELPSWDVAHRRLEEEGRASKVNHPSPAHTAHRFPAPTTRRTAQLRIK